MESGGMDYGMGASKTPLPQPTKLMPRPRRSPRPCDPCRLRKTRCVIPNSERVCTMCQERQTACTFNQKPPPRRTKKPREQERRASSPSGLKPPIQRPLAPANINPFFLPSQPLPGYPAARSISDSESQTSPGPSESPHQFPRDRNMQDAQNVVSAGGDPDVDDHYLGMARFKFAELYGVTSDMEPILMKHRPYDPKTNEFILETHCIRRVLTNDMGINYPLTFHVVADDKGLGYSYVNDECEIIERCVAPYGPRLVNLFFRIVHPSYPIIDRKSFMERYSMSYRAVSTAVLGAIYLIALNWWSYDKDLNNKRSPDVSVLRHEVIKVIQNSYHRPKLASVQAALLYLQCKPEDPLNPDHTWSRGFTGQALCIGEALGLHLDASEWAIPEEERSQRERNSWALFMQDKWTAIVHGRPSHINEDENWSVQDLTLEDFPEEGENDAPFKSPDVPGTNVEAGRLSFIEMIKVSKILSKVLKTFFTLRNAKSQDTAQLYYAALPILKELDDWYMNISPRLSMQVMTPRQLCCNGSLHLCYHSVTMTIWRRVIRSTALEPLCSDVEVLNGARKAAAEAATNAITFVSSLRPDQLEAFWFFASGFSFALVGSYVTLLLVTALTEAERDHWRGRLNEYLWGLRITGKAHEPMHYAVNRLEGAILRGMEHALAVNIATEPHQLGLTGTQPPVQGTPFTTSAVQSTTQPTSMNLRPMIPPTLPPFPNSLPAPQPQGEAWFNPLLTEDMTNVDLQQFDWLGG